MLCLFVHIAVCWNTFKSGLEPSQPRLGSKVDPYYGIAHMQLRALLSVKMTCSDFFLCDIFGEYDEENPQKMGVLGSADGCMKKWIVKPGWNTPKQWARVKQHPLWYLHHFEGDFE